MFGCMCVCVCVCVSVVSQKGRCGSLLTFRHFGFFLSVYIIVKKIQASKQSESLDTVLQLNCIRTV